MKFTPHLTLAALLVAASASTVAAESAPPPYANWGQSDLKRYLQDHNVPNPGNLNVEQLRELAKRHYDDRARSAQHVLKDSQDAAYASWSDSQLRQYLLDQGVISPSSKREELVQLAREYGLEASKSVSSTYARATAAAGDAAHTVESAAHYAVVTAPAEAYDYLSDQFDNARDFVYSSWTDSDLHNWAVEHDLVKSEQRKRRDEYLDLIRKPYNDAANNVYDTWSDSRLVSYLFLLTLGFKNLRSAPFPEVLRTDHSSSVTRSARGSRSTTWSRPARLPPAMSCSTSCPATTTAPATPVSPSLLAWKRHILSATEFFSCEHRLTNSTDPSS